MECSICSGEIEKKYHNGKMYWDGGHNAQPINDGRCCDACNEIVIAVRIAKMFGRRKTE
jgi:hypothetical protein